MSSSLPLQPLQLPGWFARCAGRSLSSARTLWTTSHQQPCCSYHVFIPDFSGKGPDFSAKRRIFLQIHRNTLENSKVHSIRRRVRRTETYPILERFLFLINTRRFGGVGAPEGREKVPDHIFLQIKEKTCFWRKIMESTEFSAKLCFWRKIMDGCPNCSAKFVKTG